MQYASGNDIVGSLDFSCEASSDANKNVQDVKRAKITYRVFIKYAATPNDPKLSHADGRVAPLAR